MCFQSRPIYPQSIFFDAHRIMCLPAVVPGCVLKYNISVQTGDEGSSVQQGEETQSRSCVVHVDAPDLEEIASNVVVEISNITRLLI